MLSCSVSGCTNNSLATESSIRYHPFPKNVFSEQWVQACGWQDHPIDLNTAHICSIHFEESAYDTDLKIVDYSVYYTKTLRNDAVPTLCLPQTHIILKENPITLGDLNQIVVYTIAPTNDDNITTITLQNDGKQAAQPKPSSSSVKTELQREQQKEERLKKKYSHIKSYLDLYVLQAHNKSLTRRIETVEKEIAELEKTCSEKESTCWDLEEEHKQIETTLANRKIFSQQEQKAILSKVFSESQIKMLFGKKKVTWSNDDMAVGYTIRHLGNKRCYTYLTKNLNIPLPATSSIKRWINKKGKKSEEKK